MCLWLRHMRRCNLMLLSDAFQLSISLRRLGEQPGLKVALQATSCALKQHLKVLNARLELAQLSKPIFIPD